MDKKTKKMIVLLVIGLVVGVLLGLFAADSGLLGEAFTKRTSATSFSVPVNAGSCNADDVCEAKSLKVGSQSISMNNDSITHASSSGKDFTLSSSQSMNIDSKGDLTIRGSGVSISSGSSLSVQPATALYLKNLKASKPNPYIDSYYLCIDSYGQVYRDTKPCA